MAVSRINEAGLNVNQYGNRNLIINGAMKVAQRGTSSTGIGATATNYYTVDRWQIETGNSAGRLTMSQASDGPNGFANSLKLDCTTADTSIAADEYLLLEYHIEGQDLQRIKKGTSDAEQITISFYVKANAAFNFVLEVLDNDNSRTCSKLFSTTTGWNRIELTYPADTTGTLDDDNNSSIRLFFWLHAGSNFTSGTLNSSAFNSQNSANRAVGISSFYSSTSNEFYLTGVQMEVGDTATDFEHRTFGDELRRCYRYFQKMENTAGSLQYLGINQAYSTSAVFGLLKEYILPMRTIPTVAQSGDFKFSGKDSAGVANGAIGNFAAGPVGWYSGGWTGGGGALITGGASVIYWANGAYLTADAEL